MREVVLLGSVQQAEIEAEAACLTLLRARVTRAALGMGEPVQHGPKCVVLNPIGRRTASGNAPMSAIRRISNILRGLRR